MTRYRYDLSTDGREFVVLDRSDWRLTAPGLAIASHREGGRPGFTLEIDPEGEHAAVYRQFEGLALPADLSDTRLLDGVVAVLRALEVAWWSLDARIVAGRVPEAPERRYHLDLWARASIADRVYPEAGRLAA
ncbi:hypothetical protein SAMN06297251_10473 [Fulvimarina manganoxydans]|uniref:Uncharacterized protein n=1 Tax=Fulvimarina manganoxydans TaxID=937218 RepID=A0A1W2ACB9_9HYPH|nr:hypothetical protein [Fulvimarina manganoxydans]SMC58369.1 hypothetical protein SAMN06297251_10473 [Fulvimarina manganoxydans]